MAGDRADAGSAGPVRPPVALAFATIGFIALTICGLGITSLVSGEDVIATPGLGQIPGAAGVVCATLAFAGGLWGAIARAGGDAQPADMSTQVEPQPMTDPVMPDPAVTMTIDDLQPADEPQNTGIVPPQVFDETPADMPMEDFTQDFAATPDDPTASPDDSSNMDNP